MPASKFTITGNAAQVAGVLQNITITADDVSYVGDHSLTFSGAADPAIGSPAHPQTKNKLGVAKDFGVACVLTFTLGVAHTDMTLLRAEGPINIACTDGSISAAGADRLAVTVTAAVAAFFDWHVSNAAQVAGVPFTINEIDAVDQWGNVDLTYDYPLGIDLKFAGIAASPAPAGTVATVTDDAGNPILVNGVANCEIQFNNGIALTGAQLVVTYYCAGPSQVVQFSDGTISSFTNDTSAGFQTPKHVNVTENVLDHFTFVLQTGQRSTAAFTGTDTLIARDVYDNIVTTFDASADNVQVIPDAPFVGVITGLGSLSTDTLDQAGDFVTGVANLAGKIIFTGAGNTGTFTATGLVSLKTGTSNAFGLSSKFTIGGDAAEVTGIVNVITITADDASYVGDHALTFSGANASPWGVVPKIQDNAAALIPFGGACHLTFVAGVAITNMLLFKTEVDNIACTDGVIVAAGADRLNVTMTAGVATALDWQVSTATPVAGTGFTIPKIDAVDAYGNLDLTYTGDVVLTFSNIGIAPDGVSHPTVTDKVGAVKNFGVATTITFANGEAVTGVNQLKIVVYATIDGAPQELHVTDGTLVGLLSDAAPYLTPKIIVVSNSAAGRHFDFVLATGQAFGHAFVGVNTLTARDVYENDIYNFSAVVNNVTVIANGPLVGTVSGLGSGLNAVLNQAADFVLGVANLTGKLIFTDGGGLPVGTFTATQAVTGITGTSNTIYFNPGTQSMPIVINGAMATTYQLGGSAPNNLAIYPRRLKWQPPFSQKGGPGLGGQVLRIEDGHGVVLFQHTASSQLEDPYIILTSGGPNTRGGIKWRDFIVTIMEGGRLFIWYTN